eukprot:3941715-Rhodomonas_salina.8
MGVQYCLRLCCYVGQRERRYDVWVPPTCNVLLGLGAHSFHVGLQEAVQHRDVSMRVPPLPYTRISVRACMLLRCWYCCVLVLLCVPPVLCCYCILLRAKETVAPFLSTGIACYQDELSVRACLVIFLSEYYTAARLCTSVAIKIRFDQHATTRRRMPYAAKPKSRQHIPGTKRAEIKYDNTYPWYKSY